MFEDKHLNKEIPVPLYFQLKELIEEELRAGNYPEGHPFPTEGELCAHFQISRPTARQAIMELVREGKLYRIKSKGTFIAKPKIDHSLQDFLPEDFTTEFVNANRVPKMSVESFGVIKMPEALKPMFAPQERDSVISLARRRLDGETPVAFVHSYFTYPSCAFFLDYDPADLCKLLDLLATKEETKICKSAFTFEASGAISEDAKMLDIELGSPIQNITTRRYNQDGVLIEYSEAKYRGDQYRFNLSIYRNA